jgi:hypothetical protein
MRSSPAVASQVLNFLVVGGVRCGSAALASALCGLPRTVCHVNLFHHQDDVRRESHAAYFDIPETYRPGTDLAPWFVAERDPERGHPEAGNLYHYLNSTVFDQPKYGEARIGVRLDYPMLRRWQLHDALEERWRAGDFCLVHVVRNPVACWVSLEQARRTGAWGEAAGDPRPARRPLSLRLELDALVDYVRLHLAESLRLGQYVRDKLDIAYADLMMNFEATIRRVARFLEAPPVTASPAPRFRQQYNKALRQRVCNWDTLRAQAPSDVRRCMDAEDLH